MSAMSDASMNTNLHSAFKREIARLKVGLDATDLANADARSGLATRYQFFSQTLHHHHEGEDTYLWPKVRPKADSDEQLILDEMEAEHQDLVGNLDALDKQFAQLAESTDKQSVAAQFDTLLELLATHCSHEEQDGVPIVQKYLTDDDFKAFMKYNRATPDSWLIFPWVCDGADSTAQSQTWGHLPPPVRIIMKPMMTRKYAKFTQKCGV